MTNKEFIQKAQAICDHKTLYVMGGYGQKLDETKKTMFIRYYDYNRKAHRKAKITDASNDTLAFDCSGLVKSILWGWPNVKYNSGVNDMNANAMRYSVPRVSKDFNNMVPGELLWMQGHVGIYIGNGRVIESTPSWADGVQVTKLIDRKWDCHFKFEPYIEYENIDEEGETFITVAKGDTLGKIAKQYKTKVSVLMDLNPQIEDKNKIYVGQKIRIK